MNFQYIEEVLDDRFITSVHFKNLFAWNVKRFYTSFKKRKR